MTCTCTSSNPNLCPACVAGVLKAEYARLDRKYQSLWGPSVASAAAYAKERDTIKQHQMRCAG